MSTSALVEQLHRYDVAPGQHPSCALWVVEVAATSAQRDLAVKPGTYARSVDEYWVVEDAVLEVVRHRDPADGEYTSRTAHRSGSVAPVSLPDVSVPVADLLAAAGG